MRGAQPSRARNAVHTLFFVNGAALATWVVHIPTVQQKFHLGEGTLGLILMCLAGGALLTMPITGLLVSRVGSRRVLAVASFTLCLSLPVVLLAPSAFFMAVMLFTFGLSNGAMEVAMNSQAVEVEKVLGKPSMSSFHAFWSVGGLIGAGVGVLAFTLGLPAIAHVLVVALVLALLGSAVVPQLLDASFGTAGGGATFARPQGSLVGVGLLAFAALIAEGAVAGWGTVYLHNSFRTSAGLAAAGYALFQGTMVLGRFFGDALKASLGEPRFVRVSAAIATIGFGSAFLVDQRAISFVGFGLVGFGLANLVPIFFSAAGKAPSVPASVAVAAVATSGYLGYLVGPPLIGLIAELTQLRVALGLVTVLTCFIAVFSSAALYRIQKR